MSDPMPKDVDQDDVNKDMEERLSRLQGRSGEETVVREDMKQLVLFKLHGQTFGVNIQNAMEVQQVPTVTDVFHTPDFVVGVVNIRGDILAVLDIGLFFGLSGTDLNDDKKILILQYGEKDGAVIADEMLGVQWADEDEIQSPPPTVAGVSSEWIEGIVQDEDDPLILLDIPALFTSERIESL